MNMVTVMIQLLNHKPKRNPKHIIGMLRQITVISVHTPDHHLQWLTRIHETIFAKVKNHMLEVAGRKSKLTCKITPNLIQKHKYIQIINALLFPLFSLSLVLSECLSTFYLYLDILFVCCLIERHG
jgi:hypothetical protein